MRAERQPEMLEHGGHRIGLGDEGRRRTGERLGLGASTASLFGPAGRDPDHRADDAGRGEEHDERHDVIGVVDAQRTLSAR